MEEVWKTIKGYENLYEVSNHGRVRSLKRATTSGKVLKLNYHKNGYVYICLCKDNKKKTRRVHKLVMESFVGESQGLQINHIDGDKTNNKLNNLEYCTQSENMTHAYRTGLEVPKGREVIDLTTGVKYKTLSDAARSLNGRKSIPISRVCEGKRSQYKNHRFAYLSDYENNTIPDFKGKYTKGSCERLWVNQAK